MKKNMKRVLAALIAVALVGTAAYGLSKPVETELYTVESGTAELYFTEVGEVKAAQSVSVYAFSAGEALDVPVSEGQLVKEGEVICRIDPSEYQNTIAQLESSIKGYHTQSGGQSRVQSLAVSKSEDNAQSAKEDYEKVLNLYNSGAVSQSELDAAKLRADNADSDLRQSKEQLALIKEGGEGEAAAEANRLRIEQLRKNVQDCTVTAPISGIITSLPAKDTNLISNQSLVATIESEGDVKIEVMVNTNDIDGTHIGDEVELSLRRRDGDKVLGGTITKIEDNAEVKVSAKGNEERLVKVTVKPDQQDECKIGYDVDVKFSYYKEENQIKVPKSAVFEEGEKSFVWAVASGKLEKREVQIKKELRSELSIGEGLTEGEVVAADAGAAGLKEGKRVK